MKNLLNSFAEEQVKKIVAARSFQLPSFKIGDTVNVKYKITEGGNTRLQAFSGVIIAKSKNIKNYSATFTIRKISAGIGVERKFPVYSPLLAGLEILKQGVVRRAKLYYLRNLTGKSSRIKEKMNFFEENKAVSSTSANSN